jgi:hypothetical protein
VVSDDLVQSVDQKLCERQFQNFHVNFHKYHAVFSKRLSCVLRKMDSENAHGCPPNAENDFGFDFLERRHKDGDGFLSHIVRVAGDETWVSFVNIETKEQTKQWIQHIRQTSQKCLTRQRRRTFNS